MSEENSDFRWTKRLGVVCEKMNISEPKAWLLAAETNCFTISDWIDERERELGIARFGTSD